MKTYIGHKICILLSKVLNSKDDPEINKVPMEIVEIGVKPKSKKKYLTSGTSGLNK